MGRPTKLTPAVSAAICESVRGGAWIETAASAAGVGDSTVRGWVRRAEDYPRDCGPELLAFLAAYKKARADAELEAISVIRGAMPKTWQAAAWYLERSYPERWGRQQRVEVTGGGGALIMLAELERLMGVPQDDDDDE